MARTQSSHKGIVGTVLKTVGKALGIKKSAKYSKSPMFSVSKSRAYNRGKPRASRPQRSLVKNDGQGNEKLGSSYGRVPGRLSTKLEHKIRQALVPMNTSVVQQPSRMTATRGGCSYTAYEIGTPYDIDNCRANADTMTYMDINSGKNAKFFVKDCNMKMTMTNASSGLAYLRIYEYVSRKSMPATLSGIGTVVSGGFGDNNTSNIDSTSYGGTLFNNPRFCVYNKIIRVRTVQLGCGRSFDYSLAIKKSKTFNPIYDNANNNLSHPGYTRGIVVQVFGQPVSYGAGAGDGITSDDVKIEVIQQRRYHWSVINYPMNGTFLSTSLPTTAGALELIDATGDVQANVEA